METVLEALRHSLLKNFYFPVSTYTKGEQMVPVLNEVGVHCAVLGNHDFGKYLAKYIPYVNKS